MPAASTPKVRLSYPSHDPQRLEIGLRLLGNLPPSLDSRLIQHILESKQECRRDNRLRDPRHNS